MPRPKPLVALHGAVNFDRLVPFDSKANSPPLANNDILVMRRAAGGDNLTLSISDINATGSVDIAQLTGGNNNDMLFRRAGVWTGTGPFGLSYDGINFILTNDNFTLQGSGQIFGAGSGAWNQSSTGNIEISGTGSLEISGGGNAELSNGSALMIDGGIGIELTNDAEIAVSGGGVFLADDAVLQIEGGDGITLEDGAGILIDGDGNIVLDGDGDIELDGGQIQAAEGTAAAPSYRWAGSLGEGFFLENAGRFDVAVGQVARFHWEGNDYESEVGSGPSMRNVGASATVPPFVPNQADPDTGFTRSGVNQSSIVNGGVEALRVRSTTASIAAHTNLFVFDYDNGQLEIISVGAADSGGAGFKLLRIPN